MLRLFWRERSGAFAQDSFELSLGFNGDGPGGLGTGCSLLLFSVVGVTLQVWGVDVARFCSAGLPNIAKVFGVRIARGLGWVWLGFDHA